MKETQRSYTEDVGFTDWQAIGITVVTVVGLVVGCVLTMLF
jgi:hypothetical protein